MTSLKQQISTDTSFNKKVLTLLQQSTFRLRKASVGWQQQNVRSMQQIWRQFTGWSKYVH